MGKGKKAASGGAVEQRISYEVREKLEEFYTGGQVEVSSDGEWLFTCCGSAVKALCIDTGLVEHTFEEEEDLVICFALSPNCKFLAVSWRSQQLKLYQWKKTEEEKDKMAAYEEKHKMAADEDRQEEGKMAAYEEKDKMAAYEEKDKMAAYEEKDKMAADEDKQEEGKMAAGEGGEEEGKMAAEKQAVEEEEKMKKVKCTRSWRPLQGAVVAMAIDPTSTLLATGSNAGIKVWDCDRHYCTHNLRPSGGLVGLLTFNPDPAHLTLFSSTASDTAIKVWDLQKSKCVAVLEGHVSAVTSVGFSDDHQFMVSGGRDKVLHVWNLSQYSLHKTLPVFEAVEGVVVLSGSSNERKKKKKKEVIEPLTVATAGDKGVIRVWDLLNGRQTHSLDPLPSSQTTSSQPQSDVGQGEDEEDDALTPQVYTDLLWCGPRQELVGITYDHSIIFYDIATFHRQKQLIGYCDEILDMRFLGATGSPSRLAVATNSEQVKIFSRDSLSCQLLHGHSRVVLCLDSFSPPPPLTHLLVTSSKDHTIRVWGEVEEDECSGGQRSEFVCKGVGSGHTEAVGAVCFARLSGSFVVSGSQDCTIKLWSLKSLSKWRKGDPPVKLPTKYTQLAHNKDINSVDVSPNDKLIVTGSQDKTAKLWNVSDGSVAGVLRGHRRGIWSVQFSPVDQCVVTASGDTTLRLWAVSDCSCLKTFEGHTMSVLKAVFITRGMQIASSGSDGLVKIWTVRTNECVTTLDQHTEKVWSVTSSGDGDWLASGGADSLICLWKDVTEKVVAEKQEARERQILQEQELSNYLQQRDYVRAVGVAINLDQPFRVYTILSELLDEGGEGGVFKETLSALRTDQIHAVLRYIVKWNMNAKYSFVAQTALSHILRTHTPEQLMSYGDLHSILEGLIPYTERHFQRLSRLLQLSMFVEYTWRCMKLPDQPSTTSSSDGGQLPVVTRLAPHNGVFGGGLVSDVTVAAADSTTSDAVDERILFVEDRDPDHTLQLEHTTDNEGVNGGTGRTDSSEDGSESELELDSAAGGVHQGPAEIEQEDCTGVEEDKKPQRVGRKKREIGTARREPLSRCRISRRRLLLRKRRVSLQRKLTAGRKQ